MWRLKHASSHVHTAQSIEMVDNHNKRNVSTSHITRKSARCVLRILGKSYIAVNSKWIEVCIYAMDFENHDGSYFINTGKI